MVAYLQPCKETHFKEMPILETEKQYGVYSYYNNKEMHIDYRPGHAIWIEKAKLEHIYNFILNKVISDLEDFNNDEGLSLNQAIERLQNKK